MPSDTARNYMILSKYAFGAVWNSMILPKYAFRHSQKLHDIVKVCLWGSQELYDIGKACLLGKPGTKLCCQNMPLKWSGTPSESIILPKSSCRRSQELHGIVEIMICLQEGSSKLHGAAKVCLQAQPGTARYCESMPLGQAGTS